MSRKAPTPCPYSYEEIISLRERLKPPSPPPPHPERKNACPLWEGCEEDVHDS